MLNKLIDILADIISFMIPLAIIGFVATIIGVCASVIATIIYFIFSLFL